MGSGRHGGGVWLAVAVVAMLGALIYAGVAVLAGYDLADPKGYLSPLLLGGVGLLLLAGWWWDRSRISKAYEEAEKERGLLENELRGREGDLDEAREELDQVRQERHELRHVRLGLESRLEARENELERERYLRARSQEAQEAERGWNRELQSEVVRMHRELGALGDPGDVPDMVLRLAKRLLGAEKGLLLSRKDEDSDGNLDLISTQGFENDPGESAIVQR